MNNTTINFRLRPVTQVYKNLQKSSYANLIFHNTQRLLILSFYNYKFTDITT